MINFQIYAEHPPTTWLHIHQLYLFAEENHFHDIPVTHSEYAPTLPECTIETLYKQALLMGLLSPYRLRQPVIQKVYEELKDWSKHCKILSADQFSEEADQVLIKLNSDLTPGFYYVDKYVNHVYARTLDTSGLINLMRELMITARSDDDNTASADGLSDDTLKLMLLTWSGQSKRMFSRAAKGSELTITIGLSATHHYISQILQLNPEQALDGPGAEIFKALLTDKSPQLRAFTADEEPQLDIPSEFDTKPVFGVHAIDSVSSDVWDRDFVNKKLGDNYNLKLYGDKKSEKPVSQYKAYNLNNVNESAGGYCLIGTIELHHQSDKIQIGELIGIREQTSSDDYVLSIGVVRRIKNSDNGLELGIQKLAPYADAVATCPYHQRNLNSRYSRSLVLPPVNSLNQPASILVHNLVKSGNDLIINRHGYKLHARLTKLLESTGVFSRFEFNVIKSIGIEVKKTISERVKSDDFNNTWTLI